MLREWGFICDRLTHNDLLSTAGQEQTGKLIRGDYIVLWISSPDDWHARTTNKKTSGHWRRIQNWMEKAILLKIILVCIGPPGLFWKITNVLETLENAAVPIIRLRVCTLDEKFDKKNSKPSGA